VDLRFFATCPAGFGDLLEAELTRTGARIVSRAVAGIGFDGDLTCAYRACLWSRIANRILLQLGTFEAADGDQLYHGVQQVHWLDHVDAAGSIAVDFTSVRSRLSHSLFGAQRVKDAIVDQIRAEAGQRPDVDTRAPDLRIHVHVDRDRASLAIDLSGESLHRRGYREDGGPAPLKENLAAGLLLRAGWPEIAQSGGALLDPMCGSGTFAIEALLISADIAPGLLGRRFGFERWRGHRPEVWRSLLDDAAARRVAGLARRHSIHASDHDARAVRDTEANVARAGLAGFVTISRCDLADVEPPARHGLVITNPPYGERLLPDEDLPALFSAIGAVLRARFDGWRAAILAPDEALGFRIGLRLRKKNAARNGPIDVWLLTFEISPDRVLPPRSAGTKSADAFVPDPGVGDFTNRVQKNHRRLAKWAASHGVNCYRVYDADLPDYAFAIDLYSGDAIWLHVQEYAPPRTIDEARAELRRRTVMAVLPEIFAVEVGNVFLKTRQRQRGGTQYTRQGDDGIFHEVVEGGCRFLVNFSDYLDTGLFLDHRPLRQRIQAESRDQRFLNLFAYTATATVHAIRGAARSSTSVDLSQTYLEWARRNFALNAVDTKRHHLVRSDCREWLKLAARHGERFDLILLDPPSFSKSKSAAGVLNVQRDHVDLVRSCMALLEAGGTLYFSTNFQQFKLDSAALTDFSVDEITRATIPEDFRRNPRIHACWRIRHRQAST